MKYYYRFCVDGKFKASCGYKRVDEVRKIMDSKYGIGNYTIEEIEHDKKILENEKNIKELIDFIRR